MKARLTGAALGLGVLGVIALSGSARAQDGGTTTPNCNDTTMFPNPIYVGGSSAFAPVIQQMAALLKTRTVTDADGGVTPAPVTLIYASSASCDGTSAIKSNTKLTGNATYYPTATTSASCSVDATPTYLDVGISDVFFETCGLGAKPATIGDFQGPVQPMIFIVPKANVTQTNITAEEAADVWGCGARGLVSPWIVESAIQQRSVTSGTQNIVARSINVLASSFHGTSNASGGALVSSVLGMGTVTVADPQTAIGFVGAADFDTRSTLNALAFRGPEQTQAFYANSAVDSFDKRNVRDGHYLPWGYEHLFTAVDSAGTPTSASAKLFIDWVLNNTTTAANKPNFDPVQVEAAAHVIPLCAMKVKRASDGGFLSPYTPADTCSCFFESVVTASTPSGCLACTTDAGCSGGLKCHHNFCE